MWLAEHGLHSDSGYLPKELMGQRDRLSDKDFNDTIYNRFQDSVTDVIQSPHPLLLLFRTQRHDSTQPLLPLTLSLCLGQTVADLPTCTDFRGTYRFWPSITNSRFHAVVYRFWKMREFLGLADFVLFCFRRYSVHLPPVKALRCRYK